MLYNKFNFNHQIFEYLIDTINTNMIDRVISSAAILLCKMCDFWGPKVDTKGRPGNCFSDWLEIFTKNASGRALMYHLLFAILLNFVYGRNILVSLSMGSLIAYLLFNYILIPIHVRESKIKANNVEKDSSSNSTTNSQQKQQSRKSSITSSNNNNGIKKNHNNSSIKQTNSNLPLKMFINKINFLHSILVGFSTLSVIWYYTEVFIISLISSILIVRLMQTKYTMHRETILMASYLLGSSVPGYVNMFLFNMAGGILILNVYHIDRKI